jgi:hypothetical protein
VNQQFSNSLGPTDCTLGNCKDKSKKAISYMILVSPRNDARTLGLFGSARGISKHLKIYINLMVP